MNLNINNMRLFQLHFKLKKKIYESPELPFSTITRRKDTRKQAAQKFYSLLVLQKVIRVIFVFEHYVNYLLFQYETVNVNQGSIYGELFVTKGPCFESDPAS